MPIPNESQNQNEDNSNSERGYLLPPGCKNLNEAIVRAMAFAPMPIPITKEVDLSEVVSVEYLAEICGVVPETISRVMRELRIGVGVYRSLFFEDAARILLQYGIRARKKET